MSAAAGSDLTGGPFLTEGLIDDLADGPFEAFGASTTRRILDYRGSTTALLIELSGAPISLRLLQQQMVDRAVVPEGVSTAIYPDLARHEVILRRSALFDAQQRLLSLNCTVAPLGLPPAVTAALTSSETPIGTGLAELAVQQRREHTARGRTRWPGPAKGRCAFREYLILVDEQPALFVHEAFNPALFPVDEIPVGPSPAFHQAGSALVFGSGPRPSS
ncbi:hypothetical protein [Actinoalloteichus hymeniacidonis]|uniref:Chorismate lyase n=1 Tax=Actinoalloteichus hymeniacidonis TaxID=340345 RepID=A0AAC9HN21_9PSEU|nr:hypothetical protein [Actinoalloteichus hymeniacidonis]AOS62169.1 chorismate lyase [Actinoalloteichus hymeniacidonis]MBB5909808.1 chorismate-pyruvate lyase [Actinoalloteichus hymeniacidonis]